jgi:hypothetical protein
MPRSEKSPRSGKIVRVVVERCRAEKKARADLQDFLVLVGLQVRAAALLALADLLEWVGLRAWVVLGVRVRTRMQSVI